jgi:hypothetical protein
MEASEISFKHGYAVPQVILVSSVWLDKGAMLHDEGGGRSLEVAHIAVT